MTTIEILDKENNKPDEMCVNWATVSRKAAVSAMIEYARIKCKEQRELIYQECLKNTTEEWPMDDISILKASEPKFD